MKKIMYAAMAALAITSCSQNEEFEAPSQKSAIGFNTVVSKTTRAAITDSEALKKSGFTVYAYTSASEITAPAFPTVSDVLMDAEKVTCPEGVWTNSKDYYWPLTDKVHFYAYATDDAATYVVPIAPAYPSVNYTVADVVADQKDFVLVKVENKTISKDPIALVFTHALTQVNFSAKGATDGFTYTVKSIKINSVAKTGTYSFGTGEWTAQSGSTDYVYPINEANKTIEGIVEKKLDVVVPINTLMLMPQAMNVDAKILVSYSVSKDASILYEATDTEISLAGKTAWGVGKKIRYTLELAVGKVAISFDPTVGPWDESEGDGLDENK